MRRHELLFHREVGTFRGNHRGTFRHRLPVRTTVEVLHRDFHPPTIDVVARCKVKWWDRDMRIGDLAEMTGASTQTIRRYEREGLLPAPTREGNGYQPYEDRTVARVGFRSAEHTSELQSLLSRSY